MSNSATQSGGGLSVTASIRGTGIVENCTICGNEAPEVGACIFPQVW